MTKQHLPARARLFLLTAFISILGGCGAEYREFKPPIDHPANPEARAGVLPNLFALKAGSIEEPDRTSDEDVSDRSVTSGHKGHHHHHGGDGK